MDKGRGQSPAALGSLSSWPAATEVMPRLDRQAILTGYLPYSQLRAKVKIYTIVIGPLLKYGFELGLDLKQTVDLLEKHWPVREGARRRVDASGPLEHFWPGSCVR